MPRLHRIPQQQDCQQEDPRECFRIGHYHIAEDRFKRIGAEYPHSQGQNARDSGEQHISPPFQTAPDCHADPIDDVKAGDGVEELPPDGSRICCDPERCDQLFAEQQDKGSQCERYDCHNHSTGTENLLCPLRLTRADILRHHRRDP